MVRRPDYLLRYTVTFDVPAVEFLYTGTKLSHRRDSRVKVITLICLLNFIQMNLLRRISSQLFGSEWAERARKKAGA